MKINLAKSLAQELRSLNLGPEQNDTLPQQEAYEGFIDALSEGHNKISIVMPTQTRKTGVVWRILNALYKAELLEKGLILTPTKLLRGQILGEAARYAPELFADRAYRQLDLQNGIEEDAAIAVAAYAGGTRALRKNTIDKKALTLIVLDEAHQALSEARQKALDEIPNVIQLAITATPNYSKKKNLAQAGYVEAYYLNVRKSVERGFSPDVRNILIEMQSFEGSLDDISLKSNGDYDLNQLDKLVRQEAVIQSVSEFIKYGINPKTGKPIAHGTINIFCNSIDHAREQAARINENTSKAEAKGRIPCVAIWGAMPDNRKNEIMEQWKAGQIMSLTCADYLIHGIGNNKTNTIINAAPSRSGVVVEQRAGRALGLDDEDPGKEALIADFVFPAKRNHQLLYGDVVGGFLFTNSSKGASSKLKYAPKLKELPQFTGLIFRCEQKEIFSYITNRAKQKLLNSSPHMMDYFPVIRDAMLNKGMKSFRSLWAEMRTVMLREGMMEQFYGRVTEESARDLLFEKSSPFKDHFLEYTATAAVMAAALKLDTKKLFGPIPEEGRVRQRYIAPVKRLHHTAFPIDFDWSPLYQKLADRADMIATDDPEYLEALARTDYEHTKFNKKTGCYEAWGVNRSPDANASDPFKEVVYSNLSQVMTQVLSSLTPREERVLRMRFGIGTGQELTLFEVGKIFYVPPERIRQIEAKALRKLKHPARSRRLRSFLEEDEYPVSAGVAPYREIQYDKFLLQLRKKKADAAFNAIANRSKPNLPPGWGEPEKPADKTKLAIKINGSYVEHVDDGLYIDDEYISLSNQNSLIAVYMLENKGRNISGEEIADYVMANRVLNWPTTPQTIQAGIAALRRSSPHFERALSKMRGQNIYYFDETKFSEISPYTADLIL